MITINAYVNEIFKTVEEIAERKKCTITSITKITGCGDDTITHDVVRTAVMLTSTKSYEKFTLEEYRATLNVLNNIRLELDGLGHLV